MSIRTGILLANPIPWGPGFEDGSYNVLFDAASSSTISHTIQVDERPFVVQAWGLVNDEEVQVWAVGGPGAGLYFSQVFINGIAVALTAIDNRFVLDIAGRYQFRLVNGGLGTVYVAGNEIEVTSEKVGFSKYVA